MKKFKPNATIYLNEEIIPVFAEKVEDGYLLVTEHEWELYQDGSGDCDWSYDFEITKEFCEEHEIPFWRNHKPEGLHFQGRVPYGKSKIVFDFDITK